MTSLIDAVRTLAEPLLGRRRAPVLLRHKDTGALFGHDHDQEQEAVAFDDEDEARRFVIRHACEPEAWEPIPLAS
jgi:hypothetical protein